MLSLVPTQGKAIPQPEMDELRREYFHAANIRAGLDDVVEPEQNNGRVITLRPNVKTRYSGRRVKNQTVKGYFACGRKEGSDALFEVYAPHPSVKSKFPPKSLKLAVALFAVRLLDEGYGLGAHSINFTTEVK